MKLIDKKPRLFTRVQQLSSSAPVEESESIDPPVAQEAGSVQGSRARWIEAARQVFPLYFAASLACVMISVLGVMNTQHPKDPRHFPLFLLWQQWDHWDTIWYVDLAQHGYLAEKYTAFFPLYPLLMHIVAYVVHSPLIAGLLIANVATFFTFVVFYRLVCDDFGPERAMRSVLYIALFPTGFFLLAGYNVSLSLSLALGCFYYARGGKWWLAGLCGLFASLTRSAGVLLVVPFLYEYMRQREFQLRRIQLDLVSVFLIPAGMALFGLYCFFRFGDFLAFSHVEALWGRHLTVPWYGISTSIQAVLASPGILSYQSLNNLLNLIPDSLFLLLLVLCFAGPWRFSRDYWSYALYAALFWLFVNLVPVTGYAYPLASVTRYLLECFPVFILLAAWGQKSRLFDLTYFFVCGPLIVYLLFHHFLFLPVI